MDECTTGRHTCDANAQCVNTIGSFNCRCKAGYRAAQHGGCEQINDCTTGNHDCHENADCVISGHEGAKCYCKLGYIGNGTICQDVSVGLNTKSCPRKWRFWFEKPFLIVVTFLLKFHVLSTTESSQFSHCPPQKASLMQTVPPRHARDGPFWSFESMRASSWKKTSIFSFLKFLTENLPYWKIFTRSKEAHIQPRKVCRLCKWGERQRIRT